MFSDFSPDSDGEILNSSDSSISSSSSSSSDGSTVISLDSPKCDFRSEPSTLTTKDFKLIGRIGSGDIGTVYLCRLREDRTKGEKEILFAMKVVDKEMVRRKKKTERAVTEKRVMKKLNHPFLPTVFADFDASPNYSCLVMEYCSGGDLHSLRHRQPASRFSLDAARFYAAEVLLALEYLHMMGIVYRDLKPENVLIRSDGHVMLSDFDLSLEATSDPTVEPVGPSVGPNADRRKSSCFPIGRLFRSRQVGVECRFVAEPVDARSNSFVGTHEYVAPEVASGGAHGSAVDWWAYGVFLYELLYGKTPFMGPTNGSTLKNIIKKPLSFPSGPSDAQARDLIARLLSKDPSARLGSSRGAADLKAHPFFKGINFALLRSCRPPVVPGPGRSVSVHKPDRFDFF